MGKIFYDKREDVIKSIAAYTGESEESLIQKMNIIANEAVSVSKLNLTNHADLKELKTFFSNQADNILLYLLPSLNIGDYLHDNTLDDRTHNMEGPISNLMHKLGSAFSNPVTEDEIKEQ